MIATAHGRTVMMIGGGEYFSAVHRFIDDLRRMERKLSFDDVLAGIDELKLRNVPHRLIVAVKQYYISKIRECWFVPVDLFTKNLTYKLSHMTRKNPDRSDRRVNKRKTFLKSLI